MNDARRCAAHNPAFICNEPKGVVKRRCLPAKSTAFASRRLPITRTTLDSLMSSLAFRVEWTRASSRRCALTLSVPSMFTACFFPARILPSARWTTPWSLPRILASRLRPSLFVSRTRPSKKRWRVRAGVRFLAWRPRTPRPGAVWWCSWVCPTPSIGYR